MLTQPDGSASLDPAAFVGTQRRSCGHLALPQSVNFVDLDEKATVCCLGLQALES